MPGGNLSVGIRPTCDVIRPSPTRCWICGSPRPARRKKYCSDKCSRTYARNHYWNDARSAARRRDGYRCVTCGSKSEKRSLEVNHIVPRVGRGYGPGCHNHLTNLETLCHECHVKVTKAQLRTRRERWAKLPPRI